MSISRRISKEWSDIEKIPLENTVFTSIDNNLRYVKVIITGVKETPYEGGMFTLKITFPADYPFLN